MFKVFSANLINCEDCAAFATLIELKWHVYGCSMKHANAAEAVGDKHATSTEARLMKLTETLSN